MQNYIRSLKLHFIFISIVIIQVLLCYYAFYDILTYPNKYIFNNIYDGLKNYFVISSYVNQPIQGDFLHFTNFNYPFGENIFFIDNTPTFSMLFKWIVSNGLADSSNLIYIYNLCCILCIVLSSIVTYKIISRFSDHKFTLFIISLTTPWIAPQINRLAIGHYNLSISLFILFTILLLLRLHSKNSENKSYIKELVLLYITIIISSYTHFYYFPILIFFISGYFFITYIVKIYTQSKDSYSYIVSSLFLLIASSISVYTLLNYFDTNSAERLPSATGYNWIEWKQNIGAFISPNAYNNIKFLISSSKSVPYESNSFLGAGTLYIFSIIIVMLFIKKQRHELIEFIKEKNNQSFLGILLLSSFICFLISIGPDYSFSNNEYYITNYLNPFYYLVDIIPLFKQFRCLARFSWPFIITLQLSLVLFSTFLFNKNNWLKYFSILFLLFNLSNAIDTVQFYHHNFYENPFYKGNLNTEMKEVKML